MKIALLIADIPPQQVIDEDGDYLKIFTTLFKQVSGDFELIPFQVCGDAPVYPSTLDGYQAVLITGSKASAYDATEWVVRLRDYVRAQVPQNPHVKWIGVCFGHQIFAEALGGKVEKNERGWEVGHSQIRLLPEASKVFGDRQQMRIMQMHKDHVTKLPEGFVNIASTDASVNQMMVKGNQMLSLQSHPEFTGSIVKKLILMRQASGLFEQGREDVAQWLKVVDDPLDGVWFAQKVIDFIKS